MRKLSVFFLLLAALLAVVQWAPVAASRPADVSGTLSYIPYQVGEPKIVGGNMFFQTEEDVWYEGDFDGTAFDECLVILHASGNWTYQAISHFSGTIAGHTGEMTLRLNGHRPDAFSDWTGQWVILSGSGDLTNVHGQGIFYGAGSPGFGFMGQVTYEGQVHFDPAN